MSPFALRAHCFAFTCISQRNTYGNTTVLRLKSITDLSSDLYMHVFSKNAKFASCVLSLGYFHFNFALACFSLNIPPAYIRISPELETQCGRISGKFSPAKGDFIPLIYSCEAAGMASRQPVNRAAPCIRVGATVATSLVNGAPYMLR